MADRTVRATTEQPSADVAPPSLGEYEEFYNKQRARQALAQAAPLRAVPYPINDPAGIVDLNVRRREWLGGVLHEYSHAA
jgi:hypothetical protein